MGIVTKGAETKRLSRANLFVFRLKTLDNRFVRRQKRTMPIWRDGMEFNLRKLMQKNCIR